VPDWFGLYAGLEATASKIRSFEPQLVHGLVQTPEYARAVIGADPRLSPEVVEQRVRFRMERQRTRANVNLIMGEGALSLVAGSPEIMAAQIEHPSVAYVEGPGGARYYDRAGDRAEYEFV
jgi:hypothetical protein